MITVSASLLLLLHTAPRTWTAGNISVEVDESAASYRILINQNKELLKSRDIESIAYILLTKDSLSLTGTKQGHPFFTQFSISSEDTVKIQTTFRPKPGSTAYELLDKFSLSPIASDIQTSGGLSPNWRSPFLLCNSQAGSIAIWPDYTNWNLYSPMPAFLDSEQIGYVNAIPTDSGAWRRSNRPRALPEKVQFSYFLKASSNTISQSELQSAIWDAEASKRRPRAFPQQVPFIVAAYNTFQFRRQPAGSIFDTSEPIETQFTGRRWLSWPSENGKIGFPADQESTINLSRDANSMRSAYTMLSWGTAESQPSWINSANELLNLICQASHSAGFPISISAPGGVISPTASLPTDSTADEAITAYYALHIISEFPTHPQAAKLTQRILGVLDRTPRSDLSPEFATLVSAATVLPDVPPTVLQAAIDHQIQLQASFTVNSTNRDNIWVLEALFWLCQSHKNLFTQPATDLINYRLAGQVIFDNTDQFNLATFGTFRTGTAQIGVQSPQLASLIGRFGILLQNPEWFDRASFALRSAQSLYESLIGVVDPEIIPDLPMGTAIPGFGNTHRNQPDPRPNFESAEGLLCSAIYELLRASNPLHEFANGQKIGLDGLAFDKADTLRNTLLGNPLPFERPFQLGTATEIAKALPGWPAIANLSVQFRSPDWYAVATPGLSLHNNGITPTGTFSISGKNYPASQDSSGLVARIPETPNDNGLTFTGRAGEFPLAFHRLLPDGSPITWASASLTNWLRSGDYIYSGFPSIQTQKQLWISTGDLGDGTEANWLTGTYYTPWLTATGKTLTFSASGNGNCRIMLLDQADGVTLETWFPDGKEREVSFNLNSIKSRQVKLVIEDNDHQGLIRITNFKVTD